MERIVFNQSELDTIAADIISIGLCDNDYAIPPVRGRKYIAIGNVSAVVGCTAIEAILMGMTFIGFTPVFDGSCEAVLQTEAEEKAPSLPSSFKGLFSSSFNGSFVASFSASFTTSFMTSFSALFKTSFATSFAGSYSYRTSFKSGSFKGGSFKLSTSFALGSMRIAVRKRPVIREIAVNGYGLNLI